MTSTFMTRSLSTIALGLVIVLSGCSSTLLSPHVASPALAPGGDPAEVTMSQALDYAREVKMRYHEAVGDQAKLQAALGLSLIPLSAAAIGVGASGGPAVAVLALGLAGAAGYGTATWLLNKPREAAYVAGIKAVTCAEGAVAPFVLRKSERDKLDMTESLVQALSTLEREIAAVSYLIARLEGQLAQLSAEGRAEQPQYGLILEEARKEVEAARTLVRNGWATYKAGTKTIRLVDRVGYELRIAIDNIVATVDEIIVKTERDPQALASIIGGLGATYKTITAVPSEVTARAEGAGRGGAQGAPSITGRTKARSDADERALVEIRDTDQKLGAALEAMWDASAEVNGRTRMVRASIAAIDQPTLPKALAGCGVKAGDVVAGLGVNLGDPTTIARSASVSLIVSGGVSPYTPSVNGPSSGIKVEPVLGSATAFTLTASKDAAAGTYVLTVVDTASNTASVHLTVPDGGDGGGSGASAKTSVQPPYTQEQLDQFTTDVKGKPFTVGGVSFQVDGVKGVPTNVEVTLKVTGASQAEVKGFTADAVAKALADASASGLTTAQVSVPGFDKNLTDAKASAAQVKGK